MQRSGKSMKKRDRITTLFLDIGGVLLTNGWDHEARARAADEFGLDLADMNRRHDRVFDDYETGNMTLEHYLSRVVFYRRRSYSRSRFRKFIFAQSKPHPRMIALMRRLKRTYGLKIAAVTNEGREIMLYRVKAFKLDGFIDTFIASCFVHLHKPDTKIYLAALDITQTPPGSVLTIDDRAEFVDAARRAGIRAIRHKDFASTRKELERFGLNVPD